MEHIDRIYQKMMDRKSKEIYKSRLMFSLTGDYGEICNIVAMTSQAQIIREQISNYPGSPIFMWGTGFWADYLTKNFPEITFSGYIDNNLRDKQKFGKPVLSANEFFEKYFDAVVVIATNIWHTEIYSQMLSNGFAQDRIVNAGSLINELFEEQYFDLPYLNHDLEEIFIDAGCFDGLTVNNFLRWSKRQYKEIIAFEPDRKCFQKCENALKGVEHFTLVDKGLWSREQVLSFHETGASDSAVAVNGETSIHTVKLDDYIGGKRITFLKMDIEGAEREALTGAADTIQNCKPKLAISIYHKPQDIWELPSMILDIRPDYKFFIRHYSLRDAETVLYAI